MASTPPPNSTFKITMKADENDDPNALACPRCGHKQPKKSKTSVCVSCKRFIPTADARQNWVKVEKLQYANMEQYLNKPDDEVTEVSFKRSRRSYQWVKLFRTVAVALVLSVTFYFATPAALKIMFGQSQFDKLQKNAVITFNQTSMTFNKMLRPIPHGHPKKGEKGAAIDDDKDATAAHAKASHHGKSAHKKHSG
jgi:hypothetical protein